MRSRIVFFDIETRKLAGDLHRDEQAGWDMLRAGQGGASAIAVFDTSTKFLHLYDDYTAEAAGRHLESADLVVGWRSEAFDVPCLEGLCARRLRLNYHIDLYALLVRTRAERGITGQLGDFKLDRIARQNLGRGKIDHGENAPGLAKRGHWGKLFNYCADDVRLTRDLFAVTCRDGGLINLGGQFTSLDVPERFKEGMGDYL